MDGFMCFAALIIGFCRLYMCIIQESPDKVMPHVCITQSTSVSVSELFHKIQYRGNCEGWFWLKPEKFTGVH